MAASEPLPRWISLRALGWMLAQPSAWRSYVERAGVHVDSSLWPWRRAPQLRRLLLHTLVLWPLLWSAGYGLVAWLNHVVSVDIWFGMLSIFITSAVLGLMLGLVVSGSVGVGVALIGAPLNALMFSAAKLLIVQPVGPQLVQLILGRQPQQSQTAWLGLALYCLLLAFMAGLAGQLTLQLSAAPPPLRPSGRLVGAISLGILITGGVYVLTIGIVGLGMLTIGGGALLSMWLCWPGAPRWRTPGSVALGLALGGGYGMLIGSTRAFAAQSGSVALGSLAACITGALWASIFFVLPYSIGQRLAGTRAGAIAGGLGMGAMCVGGMEVVATQASSSPWGGALVAASLGCLLLGALYPLWRPVLTYPLQAAWHQVLYRADESRAVATPPWLRWHSVFWDAQQWLAWPGLPEHLVLIAEQQPELGQQLIEQVLVSRQRAAAKRAQIELDVRQLQRCTSVAEIAQAHQRLGASELAGPISALLRSLSRISQDVASALEQSSSYNQRLALTALEDRLDGLMRELTRSDAPYADRCGPLLSSWRALLSAHSSALAAAVQAQQLIISPYVIGVPLTPQQAIFVGRTDVSASVEQLITSERCPPLLIYGQRRMGKTSLLNNLGRMLPSTIVPMFVDLQGPAAHASSHSGFFHSLARAMRATAQRQRGLSLPTIDSAALQADAFPAFDAWLDAVEEQLGQRTALLMLDEFETLEHPFAEQRLDSSAVLAFLRHLIQHRPRFKLLLSGSHTLGELQRWSNYLINVVTLKLSYLQPAEARQLIEQPVPEFALRYTADACDRVLALTRGHPALIQLLCAEIVALKNSQPAASRWLVQPAEVAALIPTVLERGSFFFADLEHNQLSASEQALLRSIAAAPGLQATLATLQAAHPAPIEPLLRRLVQHDILEKHAEAYRFQVELFRHWFSAG